MPIFKLVKTAFSLIQIHEFLFIKDNKRFCINTQKQKHQNSPVLYKIRYPTQISLIIHYPNITCLKLFNLPKISIFLSIYPSTWNVHANFMFETPDRTIFNAIPDCTPKSRTKNRRHCHGYYNSDADSASVEKKSNNVITRKFFFAVVTQGTYS